MFGRCGFGGWYLHCLMDLDFVGVVYFGITGVVMMSWLAGCINSVVCLRAMACVIWFSGGFGYLSLEVVV